MDEQQKLVENILDMMATFVVGTKDLNKTATELAEISAEYQKIKFTVGRLEEKIDLVLSHVQDMNAERVR